MSVHDKKEGSIIPPFFYWVVFEIRSYGRSPEWVGPVASWSPFGSDLIFHPFEEDGVLEEDVPEEVALQGFQVLVGRLEGVAAPAYSQK